MNALDFFLFGIYPYIALTVFLAGSLVRFDREQYTWKSDSSQLLRTSGLRWGNNLFHVGVLFSGRCDPLGMLYRSQTPEDQRTGERLGQGRVPLLVGLNQAGVISQ